MTKKMSRAEAIKIASDAAKIPEGSVSLSAKLRLTEEAAAVFQSSTPAARGATYELGLRFEADGCRLLYEVLDRLGVKILSTILNGKTITIVCRHKTYEGANHADLLLEILSDRIENYNLLGDGE